MEVKRQATSEFPLCNIQVAYFVGEQGNLPLSTTAQWYREIGIGAYAVEAVEAAWRKVISRHPMLRAVVSDDGTQHVLDEVQPYKLVFHNLQGIDADSRSSRYDSIRDTLIALQLPLGRWPQFCVQASSDGNGLRLHIRLNLWLIDAISEQILIAELLELCQFPDVKLPPVLGTFRGYVESTEADQCKSSVTSARAYWHDRLSTLPLGPMLPLKCSTDEIGKPFFSHFAHAIEATEWTNFLAEANRHRLMPNSAILAAYATILARWSKHRHFTFTLLLSRRQSAGDEMSNVVGNFGTTILLEVNASSIQSFVEFATTIQKKLWADIRNVGISGIEVGREINRVRSTPLNLIAPFTFTSMQSGGVGGIGGEALQKITQYGTHLAVPQVYLDHQLMEEPQGHIILSWDFVEGLFHDDVVKDMFTSYTKLLHALATEPSVWLERSPMQLPEYHWQVLANYNDTASSCRDCTLDQLIAEQIAKQPSHPALVNGDTTLTYAELGQFSYDIRRRLTHIDIQPGCLIGVVLHKGWQQIVSVLAITQAGGAYVPIDPDLPPLRQQQLIRQSNISVILTSTELAPKLDLPQHVERICVDSMEALPIAPLAKPVHSPNDVAYVIFTSGSTGVPKGVVINHRGAVNTIIDVNQRLGITREDRVLGLSSLSFDLSVFDVFGVLGAGGTLVIPTSVEQQSAEAWANLIEKHKISLWNSVPALFQLLIDCCAQDKVMLPSLRRVLLSGDWIPRTLPQKGRTTALCASFYSLGGATEASIWSVIYEIGMLDDSWATIPYGRPLANQVLHILDEGLEQCPLWKSGELYIGGRGLAVEYLNDPERTQERFITHPWTGQRLYRTGDMARMRPDGNMEFLGREDHQIKLRGFRIELGEVETSILQQPAVSAAIVKVVGTDDANKHLAAFIVLKQDAFLAPEALRNALADVLPRYMVPELIQVVEKFPLTSNGKIDYKCLDAMRVFESTSEPSEALPDELLGEEFSLALRKIWEDVLSQHEVDQNMSFFALGGTSFKVLQLVARIRKQFGIHLGLADISPSLSLKSLAILTHQRCGLHASEEPALLNLHHNVATTGPAIFCFHPVGGSAHCYIPLASHIVRGARIFGVQAARVIPGTSITIETIAERYVNLILHTAPHGPYMMVGWSMGAAIALEVGRLMQNMGKDVTFIALLDPYCATQIDAHISATEILCAFCDDLAGLSGKHFIRPDPAALNTLKNLASDQMFVHMMNDMTRQGVLPPAAPLDELREVFHVFESNTKALLAYKPTAINSEITVLYADADNYKVNHYLKQWQPLAKRLYKHQCAADHFTIVQAPAILVVADMINQQVEHLRNNGMDSPSGSDSPPTMVAYV